MSDEESKDESTDDSEQQADEHATDSDQSTGQAEEQAADSDQPAEQTEDQVATSNESAEQSVEQLAGSDQASDQTEEQPAAESDQTPQVEQQPAGSGQPAEQSGDATGGGGGAGGSGGGVVVGGPADNAVAADSGKKLQVTAEFTQEGGQKFVADMSINVYDGKHISHGNGGSTQIFPPGDTTDWQFAPKKGNVITTPILSVTSSEVLITAGARVLLTTISGQGQAGLDYQYFAQNFVFPMPSGGTLKAKFEMEVANLNEPVDAPNARKAISIITQGKLKGKVTFPLRAEAIQRQRFRVTGKYFTGNISLRQ